MSKKELTAEQEQLARFAKALGHPIRIAILEMLANQSRRSSHIYLQRSFARHSGKRGNEMDGTQRLQGDETLHRYCR